MASVLIVESSAVVRCALRDVLSAAGIKARVRTSLKGCQIALQERQFKLVVLGEFDREEMRQVLRWIAREHPIPVAVLAPHAHGDRTFGSLPPWVKHFIELPRNLDDQAFAREFVSLVVDASLDTTARVVTSAPRELVSLRPTEDMRGARHAPACRAISTARMSGAPTDPRRSVLPTLPAVVAIGASTGGPACIEAILSKLASTAPGIVVAQHMRSGLTESWTRRLSGATQFEVVPATEGLAVVPGRVIVAPSDYHMALRRTPQGFVVNLWSGAPINRFRPSIDYLFNSVAKAAGKRAVGVILSGMQHDGAKGLAAMRAAGAFTIAQDEATSAVFSMPRAAIELHAATKIAPVQEIAGIIERATLSEETLPS